MKITKFEDIKEGYYLTYVGYMTPERWIAKITEVCEDDVLIVQPITNNFEETTIENVFLEPKVTDEVYTCWEDLLKLYPEHLL